jgi:hypothetical protein
MAALAPAGETPRRRGSPGEHIMQTRAMGPGAGWSWIKQAINLGRNNPRALFGAAALLMLVAIIPSVIQLVAQFAFKVTDLNAMLWVLGPTSLLMLVIYPLLIGGFFRVIDATERNRPTHATALFDTFQAGHGAGRLIGFGLLLTLIYVVALAAILSVFGSDVASWYWKVLSASQSATPGTPPAIPPIPSGLGTVFGLGLLLMMFLGGVYSIGFGQVALTSRSVGGALADGVAGALKNLLPLLVLMVIALGLMLGVALVLGLALGILVGLGSLVHPALGMALAIPVYIAFLVTMYVVIFGVMYFIWRDVAGDVEAGTIQGFEA